MKNNWITTAIISAVVGGIVTYVLTGHWKISIISSIIILVIVLLNNPKTRYMRAFYTVLFPLLSTIYFTIDAKTENFDIQAGLKELDIATTGILGIIAIICLLLDYMERNGKLSDHFIEINSNTSKIESGSGNTVNQTINKKD